MVTYANHLSLLRFATNSRFTKKTGMAYCPLEWCIDPAIPRLTHDW